MSDLRDTINLEAADAYADARAAWDAAGQPEDDTIPEDVRAMGGGPFGPDDWLNEIPWVTPATPEQRVAISAYLTERRKVALMPDQLTTNRAILMSYRREMDVRLDSLNTDEPIDPEGLADLLAGIRSLAARIELDIREANAASELLRAA